MKIRLMLWIVLLLMASRVDALPSTVSSLCHASETTYFSCETGRHKTLSLCGSLPASAQYRYGTAAHVELQFPEDASKGADQLAYAHYFRAQVDRSEVSFIRAGTQYAIFDSTEDGKRSAGVQVTTAQGREVNVLCAGSFQGELATAGKSLRCDKDNALNLGGCP